MALEPSQPTPTTTTTTPIITLPPQPLKQKMATSFKSLLTSLSGGSKSTTTTTPVQDLFAKTDPAVDGDECLRDCDSCSVRYPRGFSIDEDDVLYGQVKGWATHLVVGTGKTDWVRDVTDEKGSVMEAVGKLGDPANGRLMLSASNMPTPHNTGDYSEPTTALLLPAFITINNISPSDVPQLINDIVSQAPTTSSPLSPSPSVASSSLLSLTATGNMTLKKCPHQAIILMCSHRTRDARCGQSAPLLRREFERHLRPLGLYRDLHDERPGGVGIYFINHVGGHKYSANVMIYRRSNAFGQDDAGSTVVAAAASKGVHVPSTDEEGEKKSEGKEDNETEAGPVFEADVEVGAAQGIWLARVKPEDCENIVRYTILKGKLVKPESQLRGGFDRAKGLMSW